MSKSRKTAALIALLATPAVGAQSLTAEEALENYRDSFAPVSILDCPESSDPDAIVVCGRPPGAPDPNRLPLPVLPTPGDRDIDQALSGTGVLNRKEGCSAVGPHNGCGGLIPIFPIVGVAVRAVQALADPDR